MYLFKIESKPKGYLPYMVFPTSIRSIHTWYSGEYSPCFLHYDSEGQALLYEAVTAS